MGEQETVPISFSELGKKTAKAAKCIARTQCYVFHLEKRSFGLSASAFLSRDSADCKGALTLLFSSLFQES